MKYLVIIFCLFQLHSIAQPAKSGASLGTWQEGFLDIHHINTGRGNAAFCILPDGTTLLIDAGELSPLDSRTFSLRNASAKPDSSRRPYEWLVNYIKQVVPDSAHTTIDYALITHFHDDHFGAWYPWAPLSKNGDYRLTGITGVAELIHINKLFDRGYPDYNYPFDLRKDAEQNRGGEIEFGHTMLNYFSFLKSGAANGMLQQPFRAGSKDQIRLVHKPEIYSGFFIRNVKSAQWIWTGRDSTVQKQFADQPAMNKKRPDENSLSLALTINYGSFTYYSGGDNPGELFIGDDSLRDVETPIAKAVGGVDVASMDHHGNRDAVNANMIRTLHPQVWVGQTWSSDHPGHEVLRRLRNTAIYPQPGDLFSTNMLEANKLVIGNMIDDVYKSQRGHVLIRVVPGGGEFYVIVLDDNQPDLKVKEVFGPYKSRSKQTQP
ncbi:MAG: hypothetical protein ABWZ25_18580 [Chitinophagaceae bacterium]